MQQHGATPGAASSRPGSGSRTQRSGTCGGGCREGAGQQAERALLYSLLPLLRSEWKMREGAPFLLPSPRFHGEKVAEGRMRGTFAGGNNDRRGDPASSRKAAAPSTNERPSGAPSPRWHGEKGKLGVSLFFNSPCGSGEGA